MNFYPNQTNEEIRALIENARTAELAYRRRCLKNTKKLERDLTRDLTREFKKYIDSVGGLSSEFNK